MLTVFLLSIKAFEMTQQSSALSVGPQFCIHSSITSSLDSWSVIDKEHIKCCKRVVVVATVITLASFGVGGIIIILSSVLHVVLSLIAIFVNLICWRKTRKLQPDNTTG